MSQALLVIKTDFIGKYRTLLMNQHSRNEELSSFLQYATSYERKEAGCGITILKINMTQAAMFCVMLTLPSTRVDETVFHNTCLFKKSSCGFPRYRRIFKAGHQHFSSVSHFSTLKFCETTRIGPQLPTEIKRYSMTGNDCVPLQNLQEKATVYTQTTYTCTNNKRNCVCFFIKFIPGTFL